MNETAKALLAAIDETRSALWASGTHESDFAGDVLDSLYRNFRKALGE